MCAVCAVCAGVGWGGVMSQERTAAALVQYNHRHVHLCKVHGSGAQVTRTGKSCHRATTRLPKDGSKFFVLMDTALCGGGLGLSSIDGVRARPPCALCPPADREDGDRGCACVVAGIVPLGLPLAAMSRPKSRYLVATIKPHHIIHNYESTNSWKDARVVSQHTQPPGADGLLK